MRRPVWIGVVFLLAWGVGACSAAQPDMGTPRSLGDIRFAADVAIMPAVGGQGQVAVTWSVSHADLIFLRTDDGYSARYEVTVILYGRDGRQVAGDSWLRRADVATYAETRARASIISETQTLEVGQGNYRLKVGIRSVETGAAGLIEREVAVPEHTPGRVTVGTLVFQRAVSESAELEPNPSRDYGEEWPILGVRVPVYGDSGSVYRMDLSVENERGAVAASFTDTMQQTGRRTEREARMSVLSLDVGVYFLRVRVRPVAGGREASVRSRFRVLTSPKNWGEDFEKMVSQVGYVASREEVQRLRNAPADQRDAAWAEFWRRRDPDPSTEVNEFKVEFLRRLAYANMRFKSVIEGWQTDMGRVYIQYGEPDDTETQAVDRLLHSWEVWYYYREHLKFTFVDREGFGEYSLVETSRI